MEVLVMNTQEGNRLSICVMIKQRRVTIRKGAQQCELRGCPERLISPTPLLFYPNLFHHTAINFMINYALQIRILP
jgi:hypothetical protein